MNEKTLGFIVLFVSFAIASSVNIGITGMDVKDTNPSSYIIIPMLMIFATILFSYKEELKIERSNKNIVLGILMLLLLFLAIVILRGMTGYAFGLFRIDALMLPFELAMLVFVIFGKNGLKRLKFLIVYSIFASPLIMLPITLSGNSFTAANAWIVERILTSFGLNIRISGNHMVSTTSVPATILIMNACVPIGTFIALLLLVLPVAYLYNGKKTSKIAWVAFGIVIALALNLVRMISIILSWYYYGISSSLSIFHMLAGEIIFYATAAIMIIFAYKFGMQFPIKKAKKIETTSKKDSNKHTISYYMPQILAAFGISILLLVLSIPYLEIGTGDPSNFYQPLQNYTYFNIGLSNILKYPGAIPVLLGSSANWSIFALDYNGISPENASYVTVIYSKSPTGAYFSIKNASVRNIHTYILNNGLTLSEANAKSGNASFEIAYFSAPININGNYYSADFSFFQKVSNSTKLCSVRNGPINGLETYIYNIFSNRIGGEEALCSAYNTAESFKR
ncbi:MAG: archaeosortase/exosortase family protein [Candidatus Micrarchaeia archaeon]